MSYARFAPGSDVYVFLSVTGKFECCSCGLERITGQAYWYTDTPEQMIDHLRMHQEAGHDVPAYAFEGLAAEVGREGDGWHRP